MQSSNDLLGFSDITSAVMAALFQQQFPYTKGGPLMAAIQQLVTSVVARVLGNSAMLGTVALSNHNKDMIVKSALDLVTALLKKESIGKHLIAGSAAECIGNQIAAMLTSSGLTAGDSVIGMPNLTMQSSTNTVG